MSAVNAVLQRKAYGPEPIPTPNKLPTEIGLGEFIRILNWYNACKETEDGKRYVLDAFPDRAKEIELVNPFELRTIGWVMRAASRGFTIKPATIEAEKKKLDTLITQAKSKLVQKKEEERSFTVDPATKAKRKLSAIIAEIEEIIDGWIRTGKSAFKPAEWFKENSVTLEQAKGIAEFYKGWAEESKFIKTIYDAALNYGTDAKNAPPKKPRKPRKKKIKAPEVIAKDFKFKASEPSLGLKSLPPTAIIGAMEVWTYNVEKRLVARYVSTDKPLAIKGTTILGYDEKASGMKKVRKPEQFIPMIMSQGKVGTRKALESIRAVAMEVKSRTSDETIILKVYK